MNNDRGPALLALARESLRAAFAPGGASGPSAASGPPWLAAPGASFVTLMADGALRGCIGTLEAWRPLADDVWENARAAAFRDPRFPPLAAGELPRVAIEVSVLSAPVPLEIGKGGEAAKIGQGGEDAALRLLRPGIDGVVFACGRAQSTFLPQVWEQLPEPQRFLTELKRKAGLPADFWSPEVRLSTYEVTKWREDS